MSYYTIISKTSILITQQKNIVSRLTIARVVFALISIFLFFKFFTEKDSLNWGASGLIIFFIFLYFVKKHQKIDSEINYNSALVVLAEKEILASQGAFTQNDGCVQFLDPNHPFTQDLDVFGNNSLMQLLNRCFTFGGKSTLAKSLENPDLNHESIIAKQKAVSELQKDLDWNLNFLTLGQLLNEENIKFNNLKDWLNSETEVNYNKNKWLLWLVPVINISLIFLFNFDIISARILALVLIIETGIGIVSWRNMNKLYLKLSQNSPFLDRYVSLFKYLENGNFKSELLTELQTKLNKPKNVSNKISDLAVISQYFSLRSNFFGPILNTLFVWDQQCVYRFETWKIKNNQSVLAAFEVLHEFEKLVSIACFAAANPEYIMPEFSKEKQLITIKVGHPLLKKGMGVVNDFEIEYQQQIFIVTGANMAGKSTFLRAIGANLVLGMIGAPVFAGKFVFKPLHIFTCMRITDSIEDGESYFHAELGRLAKIVNELNKGNQLFVILDELLKGTNSIDKLRGSEMFLEKLLQFKTVFGLIATHDLDLTKMANLYPESIKNICFEIIIKGEKMTFDYKLRNGVTQNMNALFLMKQMGIV